MIQTLEATIDETGQVSLLEPVRLISRRRALVTILEEDAVDEADLVDLIPRFATTATAQRKLLVDNPARLYGFV